MPTLAISVALKPGAVTFTLKLPAGKLGNRKYPRLFVSIVVRTPVAELLTSTFAFGIAAPVGSITVPSIELVNWAHRLGLVPDMAAIIAAAHSTWRLNDLRISPSYLQTKPAELWGYCKRLPRNMQDLK